MFQQKPITKIAEVIVPLALKGTLSYLIKDRDLHLAELGMRAKPSMLAAGLEAGLARGATS